MVPARNKTKHFSSVNHTTKTVHHHHHHHYHNHHHLIIISELDRSSLVLTFSSPKNSTLESMQKAIFIFLINFFSE